MHLANLKVSPLPVLIKSQGRLICIILHTITQLRYYLAKTNSAARQLISPNAKILLTYGGGSIKANGVYQQVEQALQGYKVIEFAGIEANPDYDTH